MNPRNFFGHDSLKPDMIDEWPVPSRTQLSNSESAVLSHLEVAPGRSVSVSAEERTLVARARGGDQEAFGVLVRLHQRQIYNLALRMLHDSEEASEATQEVFLAAWQGLGGFRGDARVATWLYRITYNYCLKMAEHRRRDEAARAELIAESARAQGSAGALSASHALDAERAMRETVRSEIANLPAKYRLVLILRHLQDLSYEEMAEVMRVPVGTVKTQLFRARALLKERLEHLGHARDESISRAGGLRAGLEAGLRGILDRGRASQSEEGEQ